MSKIKKVFNCEIKQVGEESDRILRFVGSDETPDRDNDIIEVTGWKLDEYLKNPIFLWAHQYDQPPVGKAVNVTIDAGAKRLMFDIKFPTAEEYPFADTIYKLYRGGYLNATSVGFKGIKFKTRDDDEMLELPEWRRGKRYMEQSLLELSAVPVPSNPNALQTIRSKGFKDEDIDKVFADQKSVISYKSYPTEPESTEWDGPAEIAAASVDDLKIMCAWYDAENADTKQAYKLPHHRQSDKHVIWRAVYAAMAALLGARGGVDIPEADRKGVYNHLAKEYKNFDKEPPEFKEYTDVELKAMFPEEVKEAAPITKTPDTEGNPSTYDIEREIQNTINPNYIMPGVWVADLYPVNYPSGKVVICRQSKYFIHNYTYEKVNDVVKITLDEGAEVEIAYSEKALQERLGWKTGATLSNKNRELLNSIHDSLDKCRQDLKSFLDSTMPMESGDMPMMTAMRTASADKLSVKIEITDELKQALEEIKSQVLLLSQKQDSQDADKDIDLDAIELPVATKDPAQDELNIEPGELKNMIVQIIKEQLQGGIKNES